MGSMKRKPTVGELATVVCLEPKLKIMFVWYY
jgi:hypothetical protein